MTRRRPGDGRHGRRRPVVEQPRTEGSAPPADGVTLSRRDLQERALRGSLWTLAHVAVSLPLGVIANAVCARLLGPSEYGGLAFLIVFMTVALPLSELGVGQALVQWGVTAETRGDRATSEALLRRRSGFALVVQLPLLWVAGAWVLRGVDPWLKLTFAATTLVLLAGASAQAVLLLEQRTATVAKISTAVSLVVHLGVIVMAIATEDGDSIWGARLALAALAPILSVALIAGSLRRAALAPRLPRALPDGFWRFSMLSWLAGVSAVLVYTRSEVFVLRFYDQARELGLFALAFGLSQQLTAPLDMLLAPLFPANAGLMAGHADHVQAAFLRSVRFFGLLAGALATLVPAVYLVTPLVFGDDFAPSAALFVPLALCSTLQSLASPVTLVVYARRGGGLLARATGAALAVDVVVALVLVLEFGAWGAVVANVVAQLVGIAILARGELGNQGTSLGQVVHAARAWCFAVAVAVPIAFVAGLGVQEVTSSPVAVVAAAIAGLGSFTLVVRAAGGVLTVADADALLTVVPAALRPPLRSVLAPAVQRSTPPRDGAVSDDGPVVSSGGPAQR